MAVQKNGHSLLHANLVEPPLDYLVSHLNTAGIFGQYSECKENTLRIQLEGSVVQGS